MLINFTVGNLTSYKDKKTLSMEATSIKEYAERIIVKDQHKLLPVVAIYGANSSGKSNLITSIVIFRHIILNSLQRPSTDIIPVTPFMLNEKTRNEPTFFEIELLINGTAFRYGFIVDVEKVHQEWLFQKKSARGKEYELFYRDGEIIECSNDFEEGRSLENKVRKNGLFLSVVDSFNGKISRLLIEEINKIHLVSGLEHDALSVSTSTLCKEDDIKEQFSALFESLDLGFQDFSIPDDKEMAKKLKAYTVHHIYNDRGEKVKRDFFTMSTQESSGTNKVFDLAGVILFALTYGATLIIDELDSKLHPLITRKIINLFNSPESNPGNGMLIFTTHDTNLLSSKLLRRDQVWFTEKDKTEATDLYSLVEFKLPDGKTVRNDSSYEKDYIKGRYGAIPYIKE